MAVRALLAIMGLMAMLQTPSTRVDRIREWIDAALTHRPGESDRAQELVAGMTILEVQTLNTDAQTLVTLMRHPRAMAFSYKQDRKQIPIRYAPSDLAALRVFARRISPREENDALKSEEINRFLRRAALLEGDVALLNLFENVPLTSAPTGPAFRFRIEVRDGQTLSINQAPVHWELARMLLDLVAPNPAHDGMVRAWYIATAAAIESREEHDTVHLDRAAALFPIDPTVLFFNGCLHEGYASDRLQTALKSVKLPPGLTTDAHAPRYELELAQGFLKRAVAADPTHAEARLHFGHVLGLLGRHADAADELRQALETIDDEVNEYYASMFLGKEEETNGHFDAAQTAYARAARLFPGAQSPLLAMSELAWRRADRDAALKSIREAFNADEDDDPWWSYAVVHARHAEALLEELRRPFLEPAR